MWLEAPVIKANNAELMLAYGHNLKIDGCPDKDKLSAMVFGKGMNAMPRLKKSNDYYSMKFKVETPGIYATFVDMSPLVLTNTKEKSYQRGPKSVYKDAVYAGAWHQMAKTIIRAGDGARYRPSHDHGILDIIPDRIILKSGGTVRLTVLYEGKPLPGIEVKAVSRKEDGEVATVRTDKSGNALMPVPTDGLWLYLVRHKDAAKGVPDQYDEAIFVTTLTLEAAK